MWIIKVTYENDYQEDQSYSMEHRLTDLSVDRAKVDLFAEIVKDCVKEIKRSLEDIEA